jgi:hypothetical protein
MVVRLLSALRFATVVLLIGPALTPAASAQDAMQLDLAFKDSLQHRPASEGRADYREGRGRDLGEAREHVKAARRYQGRYRHKT